MVVYIQTKSMHEKKWITTNKFWPVVNLQLYTINSTQFKTADKSDLFIILSINACTLLLHFCANSIQSMGWGGGLM